MARGGDGFSAGSGYNDHVTQGALRVFGTLPADVVQLLIDTLASGRRMRALTIIDDFTHE